MNRTAITLPDDLLADVDRAARDEGRSRSAYIREVLREALRRRRSAAVSRALNEVYADAELREETSRIAAEMEAGAAEWAPESW
jgi:metal-responsive CopG/Arc/MetJ family transcriptional regulator